MPGTRSTVVLLSVERKPLPWMSWMVFGPGWQAGSAGVAAQSTTGGVTGPRGAFGVGASTVKSAALFPVLDAAELRWSDVVFDGVGAGPAPAKSVAVPYPTKSTTPATASQSDEHVREVVLFTSATLPAVADMGMVPIASGAGSGVEPPAPASSWTR